jgi:hypothetical protein
LDVARLPQAATGGAARGRGLDGGRRRSWYGARRHDLDLVRFPEDATEVLLAGVAWMEIDTAAGTELAGTVWT